MSKLQELRFDWERLSAQANALNDKYPMGTSMPKAEADKLENILGQLERVNAELVVEKNSTNKLASTWKNEDGQDVRILRNAADFRAHYEGLEQPLRGQDAPKLGDFLRGVAGMRTTTAVQNALSVGTDSAGGYNVPSLVMPGILEALVPASSLLTAGAGIVPLAEGAKTFTTAAIDTIPTAAWRNEAGAIAMSDPAFRAVVAAPKSLAFYFKVSRELLADATNLDSALTVAIAAAFAKELDRAGLMGTGTAPEPRGILNTTNVSSVTNGTNGASLATNKFANLFSGVQAILQNDAPMPNAVICSPRTKVGLASLADSTGQPMRVPDMLAPLPVISTSQISNTLTVGTSTDCTQIYMGDFTKLAFMMRERMSIQLATELFAGTGEVGFFCHVRADVAVMYPKAFAVVTGVRP